MELTQIIGQIKSEHCGTCKYGRAMAALQELEGTPLPAPQPQATPPPAIDIDARTRKEKICNGPCRTLKPLSAFPKNSTCPDGHAGTCMSCNSERRTRVYREKHPLKEQPIQSAAIKCRLCPVTASSPEKLNSHMRTAHGSAVA